MNPPKRLRIGHRFYRVVLEPQLTSGDGEECDGVCSFSPATISLAAHMAPDAMAETLMHEALHAMHYESGLTDENTEEEFTDRDAKNLCRFFQDNPGAVRWWVKALRPPC